VREDVIARQLNDARIDNRTVCVCTHDYEAHTGHTQSMPIESIDSHCSQGCGCVTFRPALRERPAPPAGDVQWNVDAGVDADRLPFPREPLSFVGDEPVVTYVSGHGFLSPAADRAAAAPAPEGLAEENARLRSELEAIEKIVRAPYGWDGLPLVERVVLLRQQLEADDARCKTWEAEAKALRAYPALSDDTLREMADAFFRADWLQPRPTPEHLAAFARAVLARQQAGS
jgi:hypothetical protein